MYISLYYSSSYNYVYCKALLLTKVDSTDKTSWLCDTIYFIVILLTQAKVFYPEVLHTEGYKHIDNYNEKIILRKEN